MDSAFLDIANQFKFIENHARNKKTGLLYHGWDESKMMEWSNKENGCSPNYWGRAVGWYGMALVDALDYFPVKNDGRDTLVAILNRLVKAVSKYQDAKSGLWYDVPDLAHVKGNYKEASASCMLTYTIAKGVRMGYVPDTYLANAKKGYEGILHEFIAMDSTGQLCLKGTVSVSGLGGKPYRDGSFAYYMSEPVVVNDPKGVGAFILCSNEMERLRIPQLGKGKVVLMDNYFNNEWRKNGYGKMVQRHYTWDDTENGGFSLFGELWKNHGAILKNTTTSPTKQSLKNADILVIVDPDGWKDCPAPNYMNDESAGQIATWVKNGGVLLLMTNDSSNCDLNKFNLLAEKFGFHFTNLSRNMVKEKEFETGAVHNNFNNPVFKKTKKMYLKEISPIDLVKPAVSIIKKENEVIFATSRYGKGTVFAVGDPWLYNEYLDGRKIPNEYENFSAANELIEWLLMNCIKK
jgi:unsaturated rhamnogalacturonyl hydrolase